MREVAGEEDEEEDAPAPGWDTGRPMSISGVATSTSICIFSAILVSGKSEEWVKVKA